MLTPFRNTQQRKSQLRHCLQPTKYPSVATTHIPTYSTAYFYPTYSPDVPRVEAVLYSEFHYSRLLIYSCFNFKMCVLKIITHQIKQLIETNYFH